MQEVTLLHVFGSFLDALTKSQSLDLVTQYLDNNLFILLPHGSELLASP